MACALLLLSASAGAAGSFSVRSACISLSNTRLAGSQAVAVTEKALAEAKLKAKDLEIQLKLANAERQHAQAILYSISDAVLVTDPFDELVLANESAARTFNFDLHKAKQARSPVDQVLSDPQMVELIREMRQNRSPNARRIVEHTVTAGGLQRTFKLTLSCVDGGDEQSPAGVVAVLHDMTKEKEVARMK